MLELENLWVWGIALAHPRPHLVKPVGPQKKAPRQTGRPFRRNVCGAPAHASAPFPPWVQNQSLAGLSPWTFCQ